MLSNRGSLVYEYQSELDAFLNKIAVDVQTAMKTWKKEIVYQGRANSYTNHAISTSASSSVSDMSDFKNMLVEGKPSVMDLVSKLKNQT